MHQRLRTPILATNSASETILIFRGNVRSGSLTPIPAASRKANRRTGRLPRHHASRSRRIVLSQRHRVKLMQPTAQSRLRHVKQIWPDRPIAAPSRAISAAEHPIAVPTREARPTDRPIAAPSLISIFHEAVTYRICRARSWKPRRSNRTSRTRRFTPVMRRRRRQQNARRGNTGISISRRTAFSTTPRPFSPR